MFASLTNITSITGAGNLDFTGITDVKGMFMGDTALINIEGSGTWNLSSVKAASSVFLGDSALKTLDVTNWGMSLAGSFASMFNGDSSLTELKGIENWSMVSATNLTYMFIGVSSLESLNLSGWNTSNVTNMDTMFSGMTALKQITFGAEFKTAQVTTTQVGTVNLPNTTSAVKWVNVGTGSVTEPQASTAISAYDGTAPDTYVLDSLVTAKLSSPSFTYDGTTLASKSSELTATVKIAGVSDDSIVVNLSVSDGDVTFTTDGTDAGTYEYQLTNSGLTKVQNAINAKYTNYKLLTADVAVGTVTINPITDATVSIAGTDEKTYDGAAGTIKLPKYTITLSNGATYTLQDGDLAFSSADPTNVGTYDVTLSQTGIDHLNAADKNYTYSADSISGTGKYTINPITTDPSDKSTSFSISDATSYYGENSPTFVVAPGSNVKDPGNLTNDDFTFIDKATGQVVDGVPTDVGSYEVILNDSGKAKVAAANPNYNFSDGSFVSGTYTIYDVITHSQVTVTRTIHYTGAGSRTPKDVVQTLIYDVATSKATGISTYIPQGSYTAVTTPKIAGFTDSGNVEALTPATSTTKPSDSTVTVTYTPVNKIEYSEITVTRTIHYTGAGSKTPQDVIETIVYKVATNKTTGEVSYTPQGIYEAVKTPNLTGYTNSGDIAELIPSATMTRPENSTIVVTYKAISGGNGSGNGQNPTTPGNGNTGNNGSNSNGSNGTNGTSGSNGNNTVNGTSGEKTANGVNGSNVVSDKLAATKKPETSSQSNQQKLPQTDENNDQAEAVIGVSLLGMLLALFGIKRRKHDED
ncbi:MBG domain-containing protein [Pediococcus ethanolidurans]|uniref:MBG domain-containing protein n=1 Tax=Pediococcus ethanolidurans TaxID=319653 RepID=UPI0021A9B790|nr:MBG domain-containing protein [Pediococcus ethanolidurans]MCV3322131.1 MBG domain-containing protein [Pediococcus ethanolidurans]MCV3328196.1 MBG domain-containing protein [Pediococcus ethanolidurans]